MAEVLGFDACRPRERAGIELPDAAGAVPVDDLLDACAIAWSADRRGRGEALTLPADPAPGEPVIWR